METAVVAYPAEDKFDLQVLRKTGATNAFKMDRLYYETSKPRTNWYAGYATVGDTRIIASIRRAAAFHGGGGNRLAIPFVS